MLKLGTTLDKGKGKGCDKANLGQTMPAFTLPLPYPMP